MIDLSQEAFPPQLLQVHQDWIDAEVHGDIRRLLSLCTEDIQFLVPDGELIAGKDAVQAFLEGDDPPVLSVDTSDLHFEVCEKLAFKTCRFISRLGVAGGGGSETTIAGFHAWLLRRLEGRWLVSFVTWHLASDAASRPVNLKDGVG